MAQSGDPTEDAPEPPESPYGLPELGAETFSDEALGPSPSELSAVLSPRAAGDPDGPDAPARIPAGTLVSKRALVTVAKKFLIAARAQFVATVNSMGREERLKLHYVFGAVCDPNARRVSSTFCNVGPVAAAEMRGSLELCGFPEKEVEKFMAAFAQKGEPAPSVYPTTFMVVGPPPQGECFVAFLVYLHLAYVDPGRSDARTVGGYLFELLAECPFVHPRLVLL